MATTKSPCDVCGSQDNLVTHENGSIFCYTQDCASNKNRTYTTSELPKDLVPGIHSALPVRRLSKRTCEFFNYTTGVDNGQAVQIANYNGAQKLRTADKTFYWKGNKAKVTLYGKDKWANNSNANIIITEGEIDALSIAEAQDCKWPVVSLPNGAQSARKTLQAELDWLLGFKSIILCFDNDDAGRAAVEACADIKFPAGKLKIASLSEKDASDCLSKGKFEELNKIIFNAQVYQPDGIINISEFCTDALFKKKQRGYDLPFPLWNDAARGLPPGRITTLYAKTGIGKTTLFKEIIIHLVKKYPDLKIFGLFLEENLEVTIEYLMAMQHNVATWKIKENPTLLGLSEKEGYKDNLKNVSLYNHFGSVEPRRLLNILEFQANLGVQIVILDHLSMVFSGLESGREGERKDIDNFVTALRSLVERTGLHVITATQLKRRQRDKTDDGDEIITEDDARGSGSIESLSDYILFLNRNKRGDNPNVIKLELYKNRYTGHEGMVDELEFTRETGRLLVRETQLTLPKKEMY